jgi:hypothetical protein
VVRRLLRIILSVVALAAIPVLWWAGLKGLAVLVTLVCGLAGLLYLIAGGSDGRTALEREGHERFLKNIPPPS